MRNMQLELMILRSKVTYSTDRATQAPLAHMSKGAMLLPSSIKEVKKEKLKSG